MRPLPHALAALAAGALAVAGPVTAQLPPGEASAKVRIDQNAIQERPGALIPPINAARDYTHVRADFNGRIRPAEGVSARLNLTYQDASRNALADASEGVLVREISGSVQAGDTTVSAGRIPITGGLAQGVSVVDYYQFSATTLTVTEEATSRQEKSLARIGQIGADLRLTSGAGTFSAFVSPKLDVSGFGPSNQTPTAFVSWVLPTGSNYYGEVLAFTRRHAGADGGRETHVGQTGTFYAADAVELYYELDLADQTRMPLYDAATRTFRRDRDRFAKAVAGAFLPTLIPGVDVRTEYYFNGGGYEKAAWNAVASLLAAKATNPSGYYQALSGIRLAGTRRHYVWTQVGTKPRTESFQASMSVMYGVDDNSAVTNLFASYPVNDRIDLYGQFTRFSGHRASEFGLVPNQSLGFVGLDIKLF